MPRSDGRFRWQTGWQEPVRAERLLETMVPGEPKFPNSGKRNKERRDILRPAHGLTPLVGFGMRRREDQAAAGRLPVPVAGLRVNLLAHAGVCVLTLGEEFLRFRRS